MKARHATQTGFTLIEVLVSLSLFSVGMLGIALYLAKGIQTSINNEVHAASMRIAQQAVEPLHVALSEGRTSLQNALTRIGEQPLAINQSSPVSSDFAIQVTARDDDNVNLLTSNPATWKPPFTVVLNISYSGDQGQLSFPTAHVLVPDPGS